MSEEEVTGQESEGQTQEPETDVSDNEELSSIVEGFEEPEESAQEPDGEPEGGKPSEEKKAADKGEVTDEKEQKIQNLEKQLNQLGYAYRQMQKQQQQKQEAPKQDEEEALTPDQLKSLMAEHKDDPATLYNIMEYIGKQSAKSASKETMNAQHVARLKQQVDGYVSQAFPELQDESSPARHKVNEIKNAFMLKDHPAGDYFAASAFIADNIETIKKQAYEQGRQDGVKGKAEGKRKENVADTAPVSSKKAPPKKSGNLSGAHAQTAKQMGLTPSQQKIYQTLVAKKDSTQAEV